jgi:hypothetical protein
MRSPKAFIAISAARAYLRRGHLWPGHSRPSSPRRRVRPRYCGTRFPGSNLGDRLPILVLRSRLARDDAFATSFCERTCVNVSCLANLDRLDSTTYGTGGMREARARQNPRISCLDPLGRYCSIKWEHGALANAIASTNFLAVLLGFSHTPLDSQR